MLREQLPVIKKPWDISAPGFNNKSDVNHSVVNPRGIFIPACKCNIAFGHM